MARAKATLTVSGQGEDREVPLAGDGALIGRGAECDVVLKSEKVSRKHARLFRDPFGRWIVEDLGSRNGVWVGGERVSARAVLPEEQMHVGPFSLAILEASTAVIEADPAVSTASTVIRDVVVSDVRTGDSVAAGPLSGAGVKEFNRITDRLSDLRVPAGLYPEVCRCLSATPATVAVVIRLPLADEALPPSPEVLACHIGGADAASGILNLHISRRVLEAVRESGQSVMAGDVGGAAPGVGLTVADDDAPRAVFCAPVSEPAETLDVLYLDVPAGRAAADTLEFVQAVARQVNFARKSLLYAEARAQREVLDHQLRTARQIQSRLTPTGLEAIAGADVAICYEPALWVGGDYCDVWPVADGRLALAVGDVAGKGLAAAMVMANLQAALRSTMLFCPDLSDAVGHVNELLRQNLPENMFVTLFVGLFDPSAACLEYVNAGHIVPRLIGPGGRVARLGRPKNLPLGVEAGSFEPDTEALAPGAALVVVTDGITEATSSGGELFGEKGLEEALAGGETASAEQIVADVVAAAAAFRGDLPQQDDVTVLALLNARAAGS